MDNSSTLTNWLSLLSDWLRGIWRSALRPFATSTPAHAERDDSSGWDDVALTRLFAYAGIWAGDDAEGSLWWPCETATPASESGDANPSTAARNATVEAVAR